MCDRIYKILHSDTWVGLFVHRKLYIAFLECNSFRPIYVLIQKGGGCICTLCVGWPMCCTSLHTWLFWHYGDKWLTLKRRCNVTEPLLRNGWHPYNVEMILRKGKAQVVTYAINPLMEGEGPHNFGIPIPYTMWSCREDECWHTQCMGVKEIYHYHNTHEHWVILLVSGSSHTCAVATYCLPVSFCMAACGFSLHEVLSLLFSVCCLYFLSGNSSVGLCLAS